MRIENFKIKLYHIINNSKKLNIDTLVIEWDTPVLLIELHDGSKFQITIEHTDRHF